MRETRPIGGFTDQDRSRDHESLTAEWRASNAPFTGDVAVRRDMFNRFKDATSSAHRCSPSSAAAFRSPAPTPKGSRSRPSSISTAFSPAISWEIRRLSRKARADSKQSLRYRRGTFGASLTGYRQRLHDEIVDDVDSTTFVLNTVNRDSIASDRASKPRSTGSSATSCGSQRQLCLPPRDPAGPTGASVDRAAPAQAQRSIAAGRRSADSPTARRSLMSATSRQSRRLPVRSVALGSYWLAGRAHCLCDQARGRAVRARVEPVRPATIRTRSAIAPSGARLCGGAADGR